MALCRIPVFALKLLETQSNSDAEAILAAGKELKQPKTERACAGMEGKKEELLAGCREGTMTTWIKGWGGGKGRRSGKIHG